MKVVWLAHESKISGANIAMLEYINVLKGEYEFHIIIPHSGDIEQVLKNAGIPYTTIPQYGWARSLSITELRTGFKVLVRSSIAIGSTTALLRKLKADYVFTNSLLPFVGSISAKILRIPHVWWIHEFGEEDFGFSIGMGNKKMAFRWMQYSSKLIICNSEAVARKFGVLMPLAKVIRIYQPVSWKASDEIAGQVKKAKYLMFGQLIPLKGHMEVLQALAKARIFGSSNVALSLHIKGPCENMVYMEELLTFIKQHHLEKNVSVEIGFFDKEAVIPFYEVLIVSSVSEAFGRVIIEANKAGLKVIVKDCGGAPELLNKTNGVLYKCEDDLTKIFIGEISISALANKQNYNEHQEIKKLRKLLESIK